MKTKLKRWRMPLFFALLAGLFALFVLSVGAATVEIYGTLYAGDYGTVASDGVYTNKAFGYGSPDGFDYFQYASPANDHAWSVTVLTDRLLFANTAKNGWYYFRGLNSESGDITLESKIYLDTVRPTVKATVNGNVHSGGYVTDPDAAISFAGFDDGSGVAEYWVKCNDGDYFKAEENAVFTEDGVYSAYVVDQAGNLSTVANVMKISAAPTVAAYNGTTKIPNDYVLRASYITFEAASEAISATLYIKAPNAVSFTAYPSGNTTVSVIEGTYRYYAEDAVGNVSAVYAFTVDNTPPVGEIKADGKVAQSGSYVNANGISFTASDANLSNCFMSKNGGSSTVYPMGMVLTEEGEYRFTAFDAALNMSEAYKITLDRTPPVGRLDEGIYETFDGAVTNEDYVYYSAKDNLALDKLFVQKPNTAVFTAFSIGTRFYDDGIYYFYSTDKAGNRSETVSITLDRTKPSAELRAGETVVESGSFVKTPYFYFYASDSGSGIAAVYWKPVWSDRYLYYTNSPMYSDGTYYFYATDNAGNSSSVFTLTLDQTPPVGAVFAGESEVESGFATNAEYVTFAATDNYAIDKLFAKRPNASDFAEFSAGTRFVDDGTYDFYATDKAGNSSEILTVTLARSRPTVEIRSDGKIIASGSFVNKAVVFTAVGGASRIAEMWVKTPNFEIYAPYDGSPLEGEGIYYFYAVDLAGNVSEVATVTIDATKPKGAIFAGESEVGSGIATNAEYVTFAATDNYAIEKLYVKRPNASDFAEFPAGTRFTDDGTYYFYAVDKAGNSSEILTITLARSRPTVEIRSDGKIIASGSFVNKAIVFTAVGGASGITEMWVKTPNSEGYALYDGSPLEGEGTCYFYAVDLAGNVSEVVSVTVDLTKPKGAVFAGNTELPDGSRTSNAFRYEASDNLSGIEKLEIKRPNGEWSLYDGNEIGSDSEGGMYAFRAFDRAGNVSAESQVTIVSSAPSVEFTANSATKRLELRIVPSAECPELSGVKIYRSTDGGATWNELETGDYGRSVGAGGLFCEFNRSGLYRVSVSDEFAETVAEYAYSKPAPVGTLLGVADGGYTNEKVSLSWTDEAFATLAWSGETQEYLSGTELSNDGFYTLTFRDSDGFERTFSFTIKTSAPEVLFSEAPYDGYFNKPVFAFFEECCSAKLYLDGELIGEYECGTLLSENGSYRLEVTDLAGNTAVVEFTLDTTPPTLKLIGVENGGKTKSKVTLKSLSEPATVEVYFNDKPISYRMDEPLSEVGKYRVVLTDIAGNVTEYSFEIIYSVNGAGNALIGIVIIAVFGTVAAVLILRKRGKFKSKHSRKSSNL